MTESKYTVVGKRLDLWHGGNYVCHTMHNTVVIMPVTSPLLLVFVVNLLCSQYETTVLL